MRSLILTTILCAALCATVRLTTVAEPAQPAQGGDAGAAPAAGSQPTGHAASLGSVLADVAWSSWNLRGEDARLRQYATPPRGFFVRELRYTLPERASLTGSVYTRGLGADDVLASGYLGLDYGRTWLEATTTRNRFHELTPTVINNSNRRTEGFRARQALGRDFSLSMAYTMDRQDVYFESPRSPLHQRTRYWEVAAQGSVGPGQLALSYTDWRFLDRTTLRTDSTVSRIQARYLWEPLQTLGIEGLYAHTRIAQPSMATSHVDTMALTGDVGLGASTDVTLRLRRDMYDTPTAQDRYVRESRQASARVTQRFRGWTAQVGVRQREVERVTGDHSFVDVPKWWTFDGRVSGRLSRQYRLTLRASTEQLADAPGIQLDDTRSLYWNDRSTAQFRLEGGSGDTSSYLVGTYRRWANSARDVGLTMRSVTAGGTWDVVPRTSLFAEYTREGWWANSEIAAYPVLDNFAPNNSVFVAGLTWFADKGTYVWCNYTDYSSDNDNPIRLLNGNSHARYLTMTVEHRFPAGYGLSLTFAPWVYKDAVEPAMDYNTNLVMLSGSAKF